MNEAKAFAAGYAAALKVLKLALAREEGWSGCGVGRAASYGARFAIGELEGALEEVGSWFESWQLGQNEDLQESLAQMKRGEGVELHADDSQAELRRIDPMSTENMNHWSNWQRP